MPDTLSQITPLSYQQTVKLLMSYEIRVPNNKIGSWWVERHTVTEESARLGKMRSLFCDPGRYTPAGTYVGLKRNGILVMSDTPDERRDLLEPLRKAHGHCLVHGLGLGLVAGCLAELPHVEKVTVIELAWEVITLVKPTLKKLYGDKIEIIQEDALTWKPPKGKRYGIAWHDIWDNICADNLETMKLLHRRFGRRVDWQGSWCRHLL